MLNAARACDVISMKMMDCLALETLVVNHEPIELIDVRSRKEFAAMHIPGARSVPFGELAATRIFRREAPDDRARLCHFRRRSHSSQPCNGDSAIGRLRECRSGRRRNEGLARPGFSIAAQEILDQPCGRFHTEGSVAFDGSRRGARIARVYGCRPPARYCRGANSQTEFFPAKTTAKARARTYARCESRLHT